MKEARPLFSCFQQRDRATKRNQKSRFPFAAGESEPAGNRIVSENISVSLRYECSFAEIKSLRLLPKDTKLLDLQFGAKTFPVKSWKELLEYIWAKAKRNIVTKRDVAVNSVQSLYWKTTYGALLKKKNELLDNGDSATSEEFLEVCKEILTKAEISLNSTLIGYTFSAQNVEGPQEECIQEECGEQIFSYKFDSVRKIVSTYPVSLSCPGGEYSLNYNWINLAYELCRYFDSKNPGKICYALSKGRYKSLSVWDSNNSIPLPLPNGKIHLSKDCTAENIVKDTRRLCGEFNIPLDSVSISYVSEIPVGELPQINISQPIEEPVNQMQHQELRDGEASFDSIQNDASTELKESEKLLSCFMHLRNDASETERINDCAKKQVHSAIGEDSIPVCDGLIEFSFADSGVSIHANSYPIALMFHGQEYPLYRNWSNLLKEFCKVFEDKNPGKLHEIASYGNLKCIQVSARRLKKPYYISKVYVFIDKRGKLSDIVNDVVTLCECARIPLGEVSIKYTLKTVPAISPLHLPATSRPVPVRKEANEIFSSKLSTVISKRKQGFFPFSLVFANREYPLFSSWRSLYVEIASILDALYQGVVGRMIESGKIKCLQPTAQEMKKPYFIERLGVWLDKKSDAREILTEVKFLCKTCKIPVCDIEIKYVLKRGFSPYRITHPGYPDAINVVSDSQHENVKEGKIKNRDCWKNSEEAVITFALERDMRANYTSGFDFSMSARCLVEERTGCAFTKEVIRALQGRMFERRDGLWFFEDQISGKELRDDIADQCKRWLDENPIVSLNQFVDIVAQGVANLEDDFDKGKYAEYAIERSEFGRSCEFHGKRGGRICFLSEMGVAGAKKAFAEKVECLLRDRFDMVPLSELAYLFPMVSEDWLIGNIPDLIPGAILEDFGDKTYGFKLLEFYYLPEDFTAVFHSSVDGLSADGEMPSLTRILSSLNNWYGCDFKECFGLSEKAFKQIATHIDRDHREWNGAIFGGVADGGNERLTFRQVVEKQFPRVFTHEEFYQFGAMAWGWGEEHRAWHHKQLWNNFIRYDADHWSPVGYFKTATGWNPEIEKELGGALDSLLGTSPYFPIGKATQEFLDGLPDLEIEGKPLRWTDELLASVAYFCVSRVRVLNHAAAPYQVTSLLVPSDVALDVDAVAYMVRIFKLRNPHPPGGDFAGMECQEQAMQFLLENSIRQKSSQKLRSEVSELLKREVI